MTEFTASFAELSVPQRYKLLCAAICPRPIALVTSVSSDGVVNAAPFSFFNVFSDDPALVVLGLQHRPAAEGSGGRAKDTSRNIAASGHFVVHMVDEALAEAMNITAVDFPPELSEIDAAGLRLAPGVEIAVPRIVEAPFAFECRRTVTLNFSAAREMIVGEVLRIHAREGLVNPDNLRVSVTEYHPIGRLFGDDYARQNDRFVMKRDSYAVWAAAREVAGPG